MQYVNMNASLHSLSVLFSKADTAEHAMSVSVIFRYGFRLHIQHYNNIVVLMISVTYFNLVCTVSGSFGYSYA